MTYSPIYLPESKPDIREAYEYYDGCSAGLGDEFLDQLRDDVAKACSNPFLHAILEGEIRAAPMTRFPYVVYYRIDGNKVVVVTVQYAGRDSKWWKRRAGIR